VTKMIHNVRDGRCGDIRSWEVEDRPLSYSALTPSDIGRTVIYQSHNNAEAGTVASYRDGLVFARYSRGDTASGAAPEVLTFAVQKLLDEQSCPGHVASDDPKVCRRCGTHIDSLRPPEDEP
jgi:hypothetical protein